MGAFFPTLIILCSIVSIQSTTQDQLGFRCATTTTCHSLIDYKLPNTTTLSAIATLFEIKNFPSLLGANNLPPTTPKTQQFNLDQVLKIPFPCLCHNGTGISNRRPIYTVVPDDSLYHIAGELFSGLVTYKQIQNVNNISDDNNILVGQKLWIPLPCSCDGVGGEQVIHYGYLAAAGSTVSGIAQQLNTKESTLLDLNGMTSPAELLPDSILDVPLKGNVPLN
ncbi:lysM domain-containing GPI-anchored protein 2-like [Bidens hawaiensis]|uniref:lysM domain-containing GPI-anchored protein 2-like n=1 Tax=Bidens hawaiensis TaxID=980011 RepID=UPI00404AA284